ncbi:MAG: 50S ribosomal protein L32 [Candidatus Hydrogenedentes bacterium]|nr:50S ribosomal protein L32 [Candidatus Hydrogenedentota bacterium]
MPVPKRRSGRTRRDRRRAHLALKSLNLVECPSCGERVLPHRVCPKCGHYKDRLVVNPPGD